LRGDKNCQVIEGLEREWRDALCSKDMDRLRALVHPEFVLIGTRSTGPFMMQRDEWLDAIQRRDYPVVQGLILVFSSVYVVINLLVDLSYVLFDPRVRY